MNYILIILFVVFCAGVVLLSRKFFGGSAADRFSKQTDKDELAWYGAQAKAELPCTYGLPMEPDTLVTVFEGPEQMVMVADGQEWVLSSAKMRGAEVIFGAVLSEMLEGEDIGPLPLRPKGQYLAICYAGSPGGMQTLIFALLDDCAEAFAGRIAARLKQQTALAERKVHEL